MRYQGDTVLRLIEQMGGLIRRALERLHDSSNDEPLELANEAIALALGMDSDLVSQLSPQSLVSLLEVSNPDDRVVTLLADALEVQSEISQARGSLIEARIRAEQSDAVRRMLDPSRAN